MTYRSIDEFEQILRDTPPAARYLDLYWATATTYDDWWAIRIRMASAEQAIRLFHQDDADVLRPAARRGGHPCQQRRRHGDPAVYGGGSMSRAAMLESLIKAQSEATAMVESLRTAMAETHHLPDALDLEVLIASAGHVERDIKDLIEVNKEAA
jgi:hypothetical protein